MAFPRHIPRLWQHRPSVIPTRRFPVLPPQRQQTLGIGSTNTPRRRPKKDTPRLAAPPPSPSPPVPVPIRGQTQYFAPLALRDLCPCSKCVDPSSRQKLFHTPDIPSEIEARTVKVESGHVHITWQKDVPGYDETHETVVALESLDRVIRTGKMAGERPRIPRRFWDAQAYTQETSDLDYHDYMASDETLYKAARQLHTHGLLFVTNVPEDEESVVRVAERIGPLKSTFYGKTWDVRAVVGAENIAYTAQNLGFHMDLMYMEQPPHLQLLHCIRSSSAGGASLFTDAFYAARELCETNAAFYANLSQSDVEFHYDHPHHHYHQTRQVMEERTIRCAGVKIRGHLDLKRVQASWVARKSDYIQSLTPMDFLESVAWSPPFQAPFQIDADPSSAPRKGPAVRTKLFNEKVLAWHAAAQAFHRLIHRPHVIYERAMRPGECVVFDNRRILHARKAFEVADAGRERWLRGAYIDKDPFASTLKTLGDRFEPQAADDAAPTTRVDVQEMADDAAASMSGVDVQERADDAASATSVDIEEKADDGAASMTCVEVQEKADDAASMRADDRQSSGEVHMEPVSASITTSCSSTPDVM